MEIQASIALITGGASGIGAAIARELAASGAAAVGIADVDLSGAAKIANELSEQGVRSFVQRVDASDESQLRQFISDAEEALGQVDILCSNVGVITSSEENYTNEDWHRNWTINLMSIVFATREMIPRMVARKRGSIVITCSAAGLLANRNMPYMVTKHAAVALAECLAITYRSSGIIVSALCPMGVQTKMLETVVNADPKTARGVLAAGTVLQADEVAKATIDGIRSEKFLILPHKVVNERLREKAADIDAWLRQMERQIFGRPPDVSALGKST